jgi:PhoPQ-activated pathogenicity-related protein
MRRRELMPLLGGMITAARALRAQQSGPAADQAHIKNFCYTGEGRCPWQNWVPAFAGKTSGKIKRGIALNDPNES